ncbi:hypothetical protein C1H46_011922 [Malus baccata]|uniref:Uncharacterized protein n=1 Tax=Malus baccata TaxID=106549 RepID=A0A540MUN6_MALBA|nr:hypothetical protein C1H46_011922 [Malus baccata]
MDQVSVSILVFLLVAAIVLLGPLLMGPLHPPALALILVIPIILGAVWFFMNQA